VYKKRLLPQPLLSKKTDPLAFQIHFHEIAFTQKIKRLSVYKKLKPTVNNLVLYF